MSTVMEDNIKRWTGKRKAAPVLEILQRRSAGGSEGRSTCRPRRSRHGNSCPPASAGSIKPALRRFNPHGGSTTLRSSADAAPAPLTTVARTPIRRLR